MCNLEWVFHMILCAMYIVCTMHVVLSCLFILQNALKWLLYSMASLQYGMHGSVLLNIMDLLNIMIPVATITGYH